MNTASLNINAVKAWVDGRLPGFDKDIQVAKFDVGQSNPTYRLDTAAGSFVLRRKPPGVLLKSAHAVEREFRVQSALAGTDVPVPKMHLLCEEKDVIGSAFYIMEFVDGVSFSDPRLTELMAEQRRLVFDEMNSVLSAIHKVDLLSTGLSDFGKSGNYYRRQLTTWTSQYRATQTETIVEMEDLIAWLEGNLPSDDGKRVLVHGDFRIDNLLFDRQKLKCVAVLDWELSTTGHPYADLAALIMQWQMPPGADGRGLAGVDRSALGLMSDAGFIATYCARQSLPGIENFEFYLAFSFFRMASILQGVKMRALEGNASNPEQGLKLGALIPTFAKGGLDVTRGI